VVFNPDRETNKYAKKENEPFKAIKADGAVNV
jgi:hypothetical protein